MINVTIATHSELNLALLVHVFASAAVKKRLNNTANSFLSLLKEIYYQSVSLHENLDTIN